MSTGKRTVVTGRFGPVTGPLNAAGAAFATASVGWLVGLSPWWAAGVAAAGGLLHEAEAARRGLPRFTQAHRAAMWAATGVWTWFGLAGGPYRLELVASLVAGTVVAVVSAQAAHVYAEALTDRQAEEQRVLRRLGVAEQWVRRLDRVCGIAGCAIEALEEWERPDPHRPGKTRKTGYSLQVLLPEGGHRWTKVKTRTLELAADADLPSGGTIEVLQGTTERRAVIEVTTVDVFAEDVELPRDTTPRSIDAPLELGVHTGGDLAQLTLRWVCGLLIGQTGSGKSNMLTVVITQLLRCRDVVIVGIDPNGGKAFKPFLRPWLRGGRTGSPAVAWVAPDGGEGDDERAWALVEFLRKAIPVRAEAYEGRMEGADDDKLPVDADVPQIVLITDETANLSRRVKTALTELSNRSRAVSIRQLTCALRAVDKGGDGIPTDLMAQGKARIGMDVTDDQELAYLFGWGAKTPKADASRGVGTGWLTESKAAARLFKAFRARPSDAEEFARQTAHLRPDLDEATIAADRAAWDRRWDWLDSGAAPKLQAGSSAPPPTGGPAPEEAWRRLGLPPFGQVRQTSEESGPEVDVEAEFQRITTEALADVGGGGQASERVPWLLVRCHQAAEGRPRVHMKTLAESCGLTSRRVSELLARVGVEPIGHPVEVGGQKQRGYETAHLAIAMALIGQGERGCPDEVWDAVGPPD